MTDKYLSKQICREYFGPVATDVFIAKDFFSSGWSSNHLRDIVFETRKSYQIYGHVPLSDEYDFKSRIYVARAVYKCDCGQKREKWLSFRLIPGNGTPLLFEDLLIFKNFETSIQDIIKLQFFDGSDDYYRNVVSISRFCTLKMNCCECIPKYKNLTSLLFAVSIKSCMSDKEKCRYEYATGLFKKEMLEKIMVLNWNDNEYRINLKSDKKYNGLNAEYGFQIDRSYFSYRYPSYFLKLDQLVDCMKKLMDEGQITNECLEYYFGDKLIFDYYHDPSINYYEKIGKLDGFGKLLTEEYGIKGSNIDANSVRDRIDQYVDDDPQLYFMNSTELKSEIDTFLNEIK